MEKFTNLYNTTEYSFLDSLIKIDELVKKSAEHNLEAVALTDYNNMFGLGHFLRKCAEYHIKPIIGVDLDVEEYRFILLAKNYDGFRFINNLILEKSKGKVILINDLKSNDIFILDHPQKGLYATTKINHLIDWNSYFIHSSDETIPNAIFLRENKLFDVDDNDTLNVLQQLGNKELSKYYFNYFDNFEISSVIIDRINKIISECNVKFPKKELRLASFCNSNIENEQLFIKKINDGIQKHKNELKNYQNIYKNRIQEEFEIIKSLGFINYFLIISDLIEYAKSKNISVGPGRGSAAGSLISFLLGITEINPLRFDLLFERFLNPQKVSWPDIDIDIQDDRRDEVFEYLRNKYGTENTALISTFQTFGIKQSIRDVGRILNIDLATINRISKSINAFISSESIEDEYNNNLLFQREINEYPELYKHAKKIQGLPRQFGIHAAGFIIADKSISNYVPVFVNSSQVYQQVQVPMEYIENFGLLKIDLLGLKTLTEIKNIENKLTGVKLFDELVQNDPLILQDPLAISYLNQGLTEGLFQLESSGMKSTIKKVGIKSFEDLYAIISLFRPGPKDYISEYAKNRQSPDLIEKIYPSYDAIVVPTFGIIIYQEQIMQIAQQVGNMSFARADMLRRAISKKNEEDVLKYKKEFFEGGLKNGLSQNILTEIYNKIEKFAQYGFNKSHAVSYAYLTMKMAYYKARYPQVYFASLISNSYGDQKKIDLYVKELRRMNFCVFSPNILHFTNSALIYDGDIYLPFNMIKGFGTEGVNKISEDIYKNGSYENLSLTEILLRLKFAGIKNATLDTLAKASVFRDFGNQNYVHQVCDFIDDEYNQIDKKITQFNEAKKLINWERLKNATENIKDFATYDEKTESLNEQTLLGNIYNIFKTSKLEKQYQYRLAQLFKKTGSYVIIAEVAEVKNFRDKSYSLIILKDSSLEHNFFVQNNILRDMSPIKKGQLLECQIMCKGGKIYLEKWKGVLNV
ncbi:DNA polymerase III subunit alpha [Mycoplasmopsis felifaucium]|uniref:DNA polymerase III subunit alpha n=1 Tax=Mycoplasmopsis felifaucium TaxID=35768 RepID=UPI000485C032|nr:DNA polymerase III subunit alpha [Mycoplasmopsis felifaucium]